MCNSCGQCAFKSNKKKHKNKSKYTQRKLLLGNLYLFVKVTSDPVLILFSEGFYVMFFFKNLV